MPFNRIEDALEAMARGSMVVVVDDEDHENEGDIILAAEHATAEAVAFMVRHTSGMLCVALPGEDLDRLELPLMVERNTDSLRTAYTVTMDYRHGTSTGISAADRAATIRALVDPEVTPSDFDRPGHVFSVARRARRGPASDALALQRQHRRTAVVLQAELTFQSAQAFTHVIEIAFELPGKTPWKPNFSSTTKRALPRAARLSNAATRPAARW